MKAFFPDHPQIGLSAQELCAFRGGRPIVSGLALNTSGGELVTLFGPNGVGKSTLLLALAGIVPISGQLSWSGLLSDQLRPDLHLIGHLPAIKPQLTVFENLDFWSRMNGGNAHLVPHALESAHLDHLADIKAAVLSAGQQRRLSLCRVLVAPRPLWLLDEPTSALDDQGMEWVNGLIGEQVRAGGLVIAATHQQLNIPDIKSQRIDLLPASEPELETIW